MDQFLQTINRLLETFREKPMRTTVFVLVLGVIAGVLFYMWTHQPRTIPDGSQIIQSTGDNNKNSNSK